MMLSEHDEIRTAVSQLTNRLISLKVAAWRETPELRTKLWKTYQAIGLFAEAPSRAA
jgi:hypothetical protein